MRHPLIVLLAAIIALTLAPVIVHMAMAAPLSCGERAVVVKNLTEKYHETQDSIGVSSDGTLFELFVSEEGTFTVLLSSPQGATCVATTGDGFQRRPKGDPT